MLASEAVAAVAVCLLPAMAVALRYILGWLWPGKVWLPAMTRLKGCTTRARELTATHARCWRSRSGTAVSLWRRSSRPTGEAWRLWGAPALLGALGCVWQCLAGGW
jgi:hypothetical protein